MENFIVKRDYKKSNQYRPSYNNVIEHFNSDSCSAACTLTGEDLDEVTASYFLLSKSDPSSDLYDTYDSETTLPNGITISALARYVSMSDEDYGCGLCKIKTAKNVSPSVVAYFEDASNGMTTKRTTQKNASQSNFKVYNNTTIDSINTLMGIQDETWKGMYINDSDFQKKLNDFRVEQASLKEGQDLKIPYEKEVDKFKRDSTTYYDNLRIDSRNKFIDQVQSSILEKDQKKDKMASSDIMTKEREIQLGRVSFLKKKRVNQYYRISIFTLGICIIIIAIAQMIPDSNKMIVAIVAGVFLLLGLLLIVGKLIRDSKRYHLDYDEVNYSPVKKKKGKKNKSCTN